MTVAAENDHLWDTQGTTKDGPGGAGNTVIRGLATQPLGDGVTYGQSMPPQSCGVKVSQRDAS